MTQNYPRMAQIYPDMYPVLRVLPSAVARITKKWARNTQKWPRIIQRWLRYAQICVLCFKCFAQCCCQDYQEVSQDYPKMTQNYPRMAQICPDMCFVLRILPFDWQTELMTMILRFTKWKILIWLSKRKLLSDDIFEHILKNLNVIRILKVGETWWTWAIGKPSWFKCNIFNEYFAFH